MNIMAPRTTEEIHNENIPWIGDAGTYPIATAWWSNGYSVVTQTNQQGYLLSLNNKNTHQ